MAQVQRYNPEYSRDNNRNGKVVIALDKEETMSVLVAFIKTLSESERGDFLDKMDNIPACENETVSASVSFTHEIKITNFKETIVLQSGEAYIVKDY